MDLLENAVFLLSCGRVKTKLFESADVTASISNPSEHALGSLGITRGHFVYLFLEFECHSVFVWTGIISKTLLVWTQIPFYTDKKDAFSKISGYVWTGPKICFTHFKLCDHILLGNFSTMLLFSQYFAWRKIFSAIKGVRTRMF